MSPAGKHKGTKERVTRVWLELLQMPLTGPLSLDTATWTGAKLRAASEVGQGRPRPPFSLPLQTSDKEEMLGENEDSGLG